MSAGWPSGDAALERRYRRLLMSYPGHYRRRHANEIITTLLEMATPGQRRPGLGATLHLLGSGLRQRFRLPAGRPLTLVTAVLVALTVGALGAAAGSWLGAQTFADLPDRAAVAALARQAAGTERGFSESRDSSPWTAAMFIANSEAGPDWSVEQARAPLTAEGWHVGPLTSRPGRAFTAGPDGKLVELSSRYVEFLATRDGIGLTVTGISAGDRSNVQLIGSVRGNGLYLPLVAVGLVIGLLAGWLLAAALSYRAGTRRWTAALFSVSLLALALPAIALYGNVIRAFQYAGEPGPVHTVHSAFTAGSYYPFGPFWQVPVLTIAGIAVGGVAILLARPGAEPVPREEPVPAE